MLLTLFDATVASSDDVASPVPLSDLSATMVTPEVGWLVVDVIRAGGGYGYNSFVLVTPDVELDVRTGRERTIVAAANLLGLRTNGDIYFQGGEQVTWDDFARATRSGLFEGDVGRVVFYDYGNAGGTFFDVVPDLVQWIATGTAGTLGAAGLSKAQEHFTQRRRERIADRWRRNGVAPGRLRKFVHERPQHDPSVLARLFGLSDTEAKVVLKDLGLREQIDGMWKRPSPSP